MLRGLTAKIKLISHLKPVRKILPASTFLYLHRLFGKAYYQKQIAARVTDSTIMLADYPRCGIGWIRFVISSALHFQRRGEFRKLIHQEMHTYAPTLAGKKDYQAYQFNGQNTLLKTHYRYDSNFKRAIIIYRDPFAAICSYYAHKLMEEGSIICKPFGGANKEEAFLVSEVKDFIDFYQGWSDKVSHDPESFFLLKYEDLLVKTKDIFSDIFKFLNIDLKNEEIERLVYLYKREDVSVPLKGNKDLDEAFSKKGEIIKKITLVMTPEVLKRLSPELEERLNRIINRLDSLRCTV